MLGLNLHRGQFLFDCESNLEFSKNWFVFILKWINRKLIFDT